MSAKILIVDDEMAIRETLKSILEEEGYECAVAADGLDALEKLEKNNFDVIISDIKMPNMDGMELMDRVSNISPETFFIIMTAYASVQTAIETLRKGAYDYLIKPVEFDDLLIRLKRLLNFKKLSLENKTLRKRISSPSGFTNLIGESQAMKNVFALIEQVAPTNTTVLITGKSGTGKELVAKAIHYHSKRKNEVFLPVNCGAISESLIESELFGHKRGAFTGATEDKQGLFKVADGGTLFLDEIGDLPLNLQVKLLRALEDRAFLPVGGTKPIETNVRLIAATNQNLYEKMKAGEFREDLFYRLNVVEINLPSLNERPEDIPPLVNHFIDKYCNEMGKKILHVDKETMRILISHNWRGGVRELENVIERAVIFAKSDVIVPEDLTDNVKSEISEIGYPDDLKEAVRKFEKAHIMKLLKHFDFSKEETAKALAIGLSSLYRKMEEYGISTREERKESET